MMVKNTVMVLHCAVISFAICGIMASPWNAPNDCETSSSKVTDVTMRRWYQDGAFLQVINGIFTIELLADDQTPKSLYAEEKSIVSVNRGFARVPSLEWLSLEDNLIERIESPVFEGLPQLVHLSLARNRISYLAEDSFKGLGKLQVLNLNRNLLTTKISFSISNVTLPSLTHLYLEHNGLKYVSIMNDYGDKFLCDSNLKQLYLSHNSLHMFHLTNFDRKPCLSHLTHLFLEYNELNDLDIGKSLLEALSLDRNSMTNIPKINSELKFLSITHNNVNYIKNLENAKNIVRIILSYNNLNVDSFYYCKFQNFSSLEHLALDHNKIQSIGDGFLYNLTALRQLDLNDNLISYISPKAFALLPALKKISLKNNQLISFPGEALFGKSSLSYLDLSKNMVENVSDLQANMIPNLKILKLGGNPLKLIEPQSVSSNTTIVF